MDDSLCVPGSATTGTPCGKLASRGVEPFKFLVALIRDAIAADVLERPSLLEPGRPPR
jgi:hypothetical protein